MLSYVHVLIKKFMISACLNSRNKFTLKGRIMAIKSDCLLAAEGCMKLIILKVLSELAPLGVTLRWWV